ncbi:leucine-rich repeat-containing protein 24-like isoform X2 [Varroa destructor]|uniref:Ig-like domain-containing protein n=1 Tax=Varroa destructor TaxID=109461 RepID=A0A7M7JXH0_VARDE|nr:leucine-rich repeat-containing protein 24-like isoform X2 [Varroa destructor]
MRLPVARGKLLSVQLCRPYQLQQLHLHLPPICRLLLLLFVFITTTVSRAAASFSCHQSCHCIWRNGKMSATCTELGLAALPTELDEGVQVLNMSWNNLKALQNNQVANAGLVNLQKLYLSQNQLRELQEHAFYKMNNLVELDLSNNKLGAVPTNAFKHLVSLRHLLLKGNPITVLADASFAHLRSLSVLELSSCKIETVARDAFAQLGSLQVLKLDDNLISFISAHTMAPLSKLHGISLDGNAWNCDCRLRPFRDWLSQHHPTSYSPTCHQPETIRGLSWEKTPDAVFSCPPNFTLNAQDYKVHTGSNLTLYCEAWGMPAPHLQWFVGDTAQEGKVMSINDSLAASQLYLSDVSTLNGGTYTCRATNSAGGSQLNFTVQVASIGDAHETHMASTTTKGSVRTLPDGHGYYSSNAGLIGLILGIITVSLVVLSVVVLLLWSCRRGSPHHNSVLQDKRGKTPDTAAALGSGEVEPLKAAEAAEDIPPQKPPRAQPDYECVTPAVLDLDNNASMRTSSLYAANPYCCRDRRSLASCGGPIPVPMPLLPACATLPRDRRPLSLSPAEFAGQMPKDFSSLRPLNLMNQSNVRSLDLCGGQAQMPTGVVSYKDPDLVSSGAYRADSATPGSEVQDCSISQSSSTAPLLASPDLLVDQNDHPSAYFRSPSVLSTVPEAQEPVAPDGTQV